MEYECQVHGEWGTEGECMGCQLDAVRAQNLRLRMLISQHRAGIEKALFSLRQVLELEGGAVSE